MLIHALLFVAALLTIYNLFWLKRNKLPPGKNPTRSLLNISKIYGPILHVRLGSYGALVIHDSQLIRKAFNMNAFAGRANIKLFDKISGNRRGLAFSDGPKAMELRKFTQKLLKDFGYGTNSMESRILDQIPPLMDLFEDHLCKPLNIKHAFTHSVFNVFWSYVAGKAVDKNDKDFQKLAVNVSTLFKMSTIMEKLAVFLEFIPDWFPEISGVNDKIRGMAEVHKYAEIMIKEHQKTKVTDQHKDIIDAYLDKVEKTSDPESTFFAAHKNITFTVQDLFNAGVETTTTTMEWILFYLTKYPNVQEKLQKEIDTVLITFRLPSSEDRLKMPYVEAVIQEVSRIAVITPFSHFHRAMEETVFNGYLIPKDTMVIANIYAVHHDKDIWGDPEVFRPERFIDEDGNCFKSDDVLIFSCGKRSCVGEKLAKLQLFLFTVSIFKRFNLKPVGILPSENGIFGFSMTVHPFQVQLSERNIL